MSAAASPSLLRRVASAIVPDAGKHAIDSVRARRFLHRIAPINEEFVRRFGLEVRRGPFAGMPYLPGQERVSGHLIAKLVGTYERQLHRWLAEEWIAGDFELVIDVGCAEGFYAVGLARAMPDAQVHAYDIDERARRDCAELARINGVQERVTVSELCTAATLAAVGGQRVALLSDCEGYEKSLLDPAVAPNMRAWSMIVELHDNVDPTISATIGRRFAETHQITIVDYVPPDGAGLGELDWLTDEQRRLVLHERPLPMSWALLRPREGPDAS